MSVETARIQSNYSEYQPVDLDIATKSIDRKAEERRYTKIVREIALPRATGRIAVNHEGFIFSTREELDAGKEPFPPEGIGGVEIDENDPAALRQFGICAQTDPDAFFVEKGGSTREAKQICLACDIKDACLQYALDKGERYGVWGGLSDRERRRLKSA